MKYIVISMVNDFPLPEQPAWPSVFETKEAAITAARAQHSELLARHGIDLYTMVAEEEADTTVEWIIYRGEEIDDIDRATDLAERLAE